MNAITTKQIVEIFKEFNEQNSYLKRLLFFENHFHVIFDAFPAFDPSLRLLNEPDQLSLLTDIYKNDRSMYLSLRKDFRINKKNYVFDVRPVNSNRMTFNDFIIENVTHGPKGMDGILTSIEDDNYTNAKVISGLLQASDQSIRMLLSYLQNKQVRNFRIQFMTVFYEGYSDHLNGITRSFRMKKKFIELYLYAQGLLFSRYRQKLKTLSLHKDISHDMIDLDHFDILDWRDRVLMLKNMGILDALRSKIQDPVEKIKRQKIGRIICLIVGQQPSMTDSIADYISRIH